MTSCTKIPTIGVQLRLLRHLRYDRHNDCLPPGIRRSGRLQPDASPITYRRAASPPRIQSRSARPLDVDIILKALESPTDVLVLAVNTQSGNWKDMALLRRLHITYPAVAKVLLLESFDREV